MINIQITLLFHVNDERGQSPHKSYGKLERNKQKFKRLKQAPGR